MKVMPTSSKLDESLVWTLNDDVPKGINHVQKDLGALNRQRHKTLQCVHKKLDVLDVLVEVGEDQNGTEIAHPLRK